ncbi:MAG TPA: hypothetical protein PK866_05855, partial [Nitrospira sp.]|nr:hypothetical protein [Nitrospira sp.]
MIHASAPALVSNGRVSGNTRPSRIHSAGLYEPLVRQGFLRQEELALALSEAVRRRLDVAT